jgi:N-acylglucosamine-6-phosphate 2-epimerase
LTGTPARTPHNQVLASLRGGLVVSCQARPGNPMHGPEHMTAMARAATAGGAVGIRVEGYPDVRAIRAALALPLIGLWKTDDQGVYITPTVKHACAVVDAGADIVATDGTRRPRPDGATFGDIVTAVHERGRLVLADCATLADALDAEQAGADLVGTTLSGYTPDTARRDGPDLTLVAELAAKSSVPVVAEGRIHTPEQARQAREAGAWAVVVGTAITSPQWITTQFAHALGD